MIDIQVVYDKLCTFKTADELALYFQDLGIKGLEQDAMSCPISKYVIQETRLEGVVTNTEYLNVESIKFQGRHTYAMSDFVAGFDHGRYPDLVEEVTPWWEELL